MIDKRSAFVVVFGILLITSIQASEDKDLATFLSKLGLSAETLGDLKDSLGDISYPRAEEGKSVFGNPIETYVDEETDNVVTTVAPAADPMADPLESLSLADYANIASKLQDLKVDDSLADTLSCAPGEGPDYYRILPQWVFSAVPGGERKTLSGDCFKATTISAFQKNANTITLEFDLANKDSLLCTQTYFISAAKHMHMEHFMLAKKHTIDFTGLDKDDLDDIKFNGIHVFNFCDGLKDSVIDLFMTLKLYLGGFGTNPKIPIFGSHVPGYMRKANVDFLKKSSNFQLRERNAGRINIDEKDVHSGDFLAIYRLDGLDPIIMWGSGARVGHSTMAMWDDQGELWVLESQDGWYWPTHGIQKTPWKLWLDRAENADFNVALLPLSPEKRAKFDTKKAWEWFNNTAEGLPYGYHNMVLSWFDLADNQNLPIMLKDVTFVPAFILLDRIAPAFATRLIGEAMNKRLGTEGLNIAQTVAEGARRGLRWSDMWAIVEQEGWVYSDGMSYVCSCFVVAMYKRGGLFGDLTINSTEFTPRDLYELDFFDHDYKKPQVCEDADPELPYCQLLGKHKVDLTNYNTRKPYDHMYEKCPSIAPTYARPDNC
eukprot:CAMPEP_0115009958 /NCGR_PEP_ID=MMETSP0216-20121206/22979_1 /TAXON_ID=223996 /ORGANISM="Protocruzia adherens, Strain Boccale" /LENGTH=601 /DNA_ID=CAMNT_0002377979 /DNA_START=45 /DNA_END=1850 /DNA_ORIENTATION=+